MISDLLDIGSSAPWPVLPPGVHVTTLAEVGARFATTPHRRKLFDGLCKAVGSLANAGCTVLYLDGSFVTGKVHPDDYDGCWTITGVDPEKLDPALLDFSGKREAQKLKYFGELFIAEFPGAVGLSFIEFFQIEKFSGKPKGILKIQLGPQGSAP